jgi:hypothetical protein
MSELRREKLGVDVCTLHLIKIPQALWLNP